MVEQAAGRVSQNVLIFLCVALHGDSVILWKWQDRRGPFWRGLVGCEHPLDAGVGGISPSLPGCDFAA
jgi:hypothetical protein